MVGICRRYYRSFSDGLLSSLVLVLSLVYCPREYACITVIPPSPTWGPNCSCGPQGLERRGMRGGTYERRRYTRHPSFILLYYVGRVTKGAVGLEA